MENPIQSPTTVDQVAAAVMEGIAENQAAAASTGQPTPAITTPSQIGPAEAWHKEPRSNFLWNDDGTVRYKADGKVLRRGGNPSKPRPGDVLADGSIYQPDRARKPKPTATAAPAATADPVDALIDPDKASAASAKNADSGGDSGGGGEPLGEPAGDILADGFFQFMGESAKPTPAERDTIKGAARKTVGGMTMPAWMVLLTFGGLYLFRVWLEKRKNAPPSKANLQGPTHAQPDNDPRVHMRNDPLWEKLHRPGAYGNG